MISLIPNYIQKVIFDKKKIIRVFEEALVIDSELGDDCRCVEVYIETIGRREPYSFLVDLVKEPAITVALNRGIQPNTLPILNVAIRFRNSFHVVPAGPALL
jgi:hypothetical protein